jgi:ubiquitin carboxyl-terminal hydrolase 9/24
MIYISIEILDEQNQNDILNISFPVEKLQRLDEMINKTHWIVPVLAKQELEILLDASIRQCKQNLDAKSEHCQI